MIVIFKEFTWRISLIFFSASLDIKNRSGKIYFIFWSFRKLKNQNLFIYLFILLIYLFFSEVYPYKYITQDNLLGYTWWCNLMNISELDFKSKKVLCLLILDYQIHLNFIKNMFTIFRTRITTCMFQLIKLNRLRF